MPKSSIAVRPQQQHCAGTHGGQGAMGALPHCDMSAIALLSSPNLPVLAVQIERQVKRE